jgi:hypothetical protein
MNAQRYSSNEKLQLVHSIRNICIVVFRKHTITTQWCYIVLGEESLTTCKELNICIRVESGENKYSLKALFTREVRANVQPKSSISIGAKVEISRNSLTL